MTAFSREDFIVKLTEDLDLKSVWILEKGGYSLDISDIPDLINSVPSDPHMAASQIIKLHTLVSLSHVQLGIELDSVKAAKEERESEVKLETKENEAELKQVYGRITAKVIDGIVGTDETYLALQDLERSYKRAKEVVAVVKEMLFQIREIIQSMIRHYGSMPMVSTPVSPEEAEAIVKKFTRQIRDIDTSGLVSTD